MTTSLYAEEIPEAKKLMEYAKKIFYSEKYYDDDYEYRFAKCKSYFHLLAT